MMLEDTRNLVLHAFALMHSPPRCTWDSELHDTPMPPVLDFLVSAPLAVLVYKALRVLVSIVITLLRVSVGSLVTFVVRIVIDRIKVDSTVEGSSRKGIVAGFDELSEVRRCCSEDFLKSVDVGKLLLRSTACVETEIGRSRKVLSDVVVRGRKAWISRRRKGSIDDSDLIL